ncbi:MAG: bifunctional folylpolyglutamate synthase/dihydrofolate synthase [Nitrospirae bacterium]|nr:bifunctional folylpolyglutamate synthase/dihydrofolate synthase [Nitrospirota bacterium]
MSYDNTINYLYGLQKYGIKLGLDNIARLLSCFGNPQNSFRSIHIAGTNGKGSTSAMTASILQAAGLKIGLFTSPHLVSFTERIRVDGKEITESEVISLTEDIRGALRDKGNTPLNPPLLRGELKGGVMHHELNPTFFEFVTAMDFLYFKRRNVDWAVVETGMGGRLDATNVLIPEVSIITTISYDHKEFLGNTISAIAVEKAGIIKEGIPVVCAAQENEAADIIRKRAEERSSPLYIYGKDFGGTLRASSMDGIAFDYGDSDCTISDIFVPLTGEYQLVNACLAIKAAMLALQNMMHDTRYTIYPPLSPFTKGGSKRRYHESSILNHASCIMHRESCIREGLAATRWPGRLEFVSDNPPILIDGAHNPSAAGVLAETLQKNFLQRYNKLILILGIMSDKDIKGIMTPLLSIASEIILTSPQYERAAPPDILSGYAGSLGFKNIHIAPTIKTAIETAIRFVEQNNCGLQIADCGINQLRNAERGMRIEKKPEIRNPKSLILITGSFYTIGEAKEVLGEKGILSRLRETL